MTLSELSKRLSGDGNPVSLATLSYWRSGGRQPGEASSPIVDSIEGILRLPVGALVDLVPLARPIYGLAFPRPVRELVFQLQFHPESVPSWVEEVEDDREEAAPGRFVPLDGRASVVISRRHFGPGAVFLRWGSD